MWEDICMLWTGGVSRWSWLLSSTILKILDFLSFVFFVLFFFIKTVLRCLTEPSQNLNPKFISFDTIMWVKCFQFSVFFLLILGFISFDILFTVLRNLRILYKSLSVSGFLSTVDSLSDESDEFWIFFDWISSKWSPHSAKPLSHRLWLHLNYWKPCAYGGLQLDLSPCRNTWTSFVVALREEGCFSLATSMVSLLSLTDIDQWGFTFWLSLLLTPSPHSVITV